MTGSALSVGTPCDERTPEQTQGGEHTTKTTIRCCSGGGAAISSPCSLSRRGTLSRLPAGSLRSAFDRAPAASPTLLPGRGNGSSQSRRLYSVRRLISKGISHYPFDFSYHE